MALGVHISRASRTQQSVRKARAFRRSDISEAQWRISNSF
jgi:hypothetical protein